MSSRSSGEEFTELTLFIAAILVGLCVGAGRLVLASVRHCIRVYSRYSNVAPMLWYLAAAYVVVLIVALLVGIAGAVAAALLTATIATVVYLLVTTVMGTVLEQRAQQPAADEELHHIQWSE